MLQRNNDISNIKLIDFGLSKDVGIQYSTKSICSGTPFYIAPEIVESNFTAASDIWSLGVVMYICLTGKLPFTGNSTQKIFDNVLNKDLNI